MTATEELRRLLDERGVEWEDASPVPSMKPWKTSFTSFTGEEVTIGAYDEPKWLMGTMVFHTPAQAIAATVGRGTCREVEDEDTGFIVCSECGAVHDVSYTSYYCWCCGRRVVSE